MLGRLAGFSDKKGLRLSKDVDECEPLAAGAAARSNVPNFSRLMLEDAEMSAARLRGLDEAEGLRAERAATAGAAAAEAAAAGLAAARAAGSGAGVAAATGTGAAAAGARARAGGAARTGAAGAGARAGASARTGASGDAARAEARAGAGAGAGDGAAAARGTSATRGRLSARPDNVPQLELGSAGAGFELGSANAHRGGHQQEVGMAVQVDPIKPTLEAPGTMPLMTPKHDKLLSNSDFNFHLRR